MIGVDLDFSIASRSSQGPHLSKEHMLAIQYMIQLNLAGFHIAKCVRLMT